jgi:hypothetical protein
MIGKHFLQRNLQIIDSIGIAFDSIGIDLLLKISHSCSSTQLQHLGQISSYENKDQ